MTTTEKVNIAYNLKIAESTMDLSTEAINNANQYVFYIYIYFFLFPTNY